MSDTSSEILLTGAGSSGDSVFSGFGSDLNTPVGSEIDDSTETTRSDEEGDDFIFELTRQMAENMLQEDEDDEEKKSMTSKSFDLSMEQSNSTSKYCHGEGLLTAPKSQTPPSVLPNWATQIYPNQSQQKHEYRQVQNREHGHGSRGTGFLSPLQAGPGMRVVFLGGVGSRSSGSSGTGVFLPHAPNNNAAAAADHQSRKKTGCSTVLIPERVLQTLKHHFEKRAAQVHSSNALHTQQNQRLQPDETPQTITNNQELQLPQEWTY